MLFDNGALKQAVDVSNVYNDTFLKNIYKDGKLIWPGIVSSCAQATNRSGACAAGP